MSWEILLASQYWYEGTTDPFEQCSFWILHWFCQQKKISLLMICFKTKSDSIVHWGIYPLPNVLSPIWINYNDLTTTSLEQWEWHDVELLYYIAYSDTGFQSQKRLGFNGKSTTGIVLYMFVLWYTDLSSNLHKSRNCFNHQWHIMMNLLYLLRFCSKHWQAEWWMEGQ